MQKIRLEFLICLFFFFILAVMAFVFNGTGDDGDSILHFMYAKYAFAHPENFFNHWAKPIYVLLMAIPAQLGFVAVKIVNVALMTMTMFMTFKIAEKIHINPAYVTSLFFIGAPIAITFTLSGLTEPLFAFWLIWVIYFAFHNRLFAATIALSFLPFVRSEGLIILVVFATYLIVKNEWKKIPFLGIGHVVMGIIGYPIYKDLLWPITKIPYAGIRNVSYGHGSWDFYLGNFTQVFGNFISIALVIGLAIGLLRLFGHIINKMHFPKEEIWLIYGMFIAYIVAHSIFWTFGIFNSFGLLRVLLAVIPLIALIGGNAVHHWLAFAKSLHVEKFAWLIIVASTGIGLWYKQDWNYLLKLNEDQKLFQQLATKYKDELKDYCIFSDAVYPTFILDADYFNPHQTKLLTTLYNGEFIPAKSAVIWDHRFSITEAHINVDKLKNDTRFKEVDVFTSDGRSLIYLFVSDSMKRNSTVLRSYDFENNEIANKDSNIVKSGKYALTLSSKNEYSPGINMLLEDLKQGNSVRIKFDYYFADENVAKPQIVFSYEEMNGKILNWNSKAILNETSKPKTWNSFFFDIVLNRENYPDKNIKIYIWNPSESSLHIDNLEFSLH